ncbi:MAG: MoaD/ThiS family protein [Planctomycetota bacterium]
MQVTIQLFAGAREAAGADNIAVDIDDDSNYADLAEAVTAACPALAPLVAAGRFAAGDQYVDKSAAVNPAADIALIPPVSGG